MTFYSLDATAILDPAPAWQGLPLNVYRPRAARRPYCRPATIPHTISHLHARLTVLGILHPHTTGDRFEPIPHWQISQYSPATPPVVVVLREHSSTGRLHAWLEPATTPHGREINHDRCEYEFGGNYAGTSDPRFGDILTDRLGYPAPNVLAVMDHKPITPTS